MDSAVDILNTFGRGQH